MFDMITETPAADGQIQTTTAAVPAVTKTMGSTEADFIRQLKAFAGAENVTVDDGAGKASVVTKEGAVTVAFEDRQPRRAGMLRIPTTAIDIDFGDLDTAQADAFMARFDRSFLRMGG
ncbi:MAG: hypothetical protein QNJ20_13535 [Paracoccaceae bacterium]|nr:hypothetical protein [Paracoccaceae bacterium]